MVGSGQYSDEVLAFSERPPGEEGRRSNAYVLVFVLLLALLLTMQLVVAPRLLRQVIECRRLHFGLSMRRGLTVGLSGVKLFDPSQRETVNGCALGMFLPSRLHCFSIDELSLELSVLALLSLLRGHRRPDTEEGDGGESAVPAPSSGLRLVTLRLEGCHMLHEPCGAPEWYGGEAVLLDYLLSVKEWAVGRAADVVAAHAGGGCAVPPPHLSAASRFVRQRLLPQLKIAVSRFDLVYTDQPADALLAIRAASITLRFGDPPAATVAGVAPQRVSVRMRGLRLHAEPLEASVPSPQPAEGAESAAAPAEAAPSMAPVLDMRQGGGGGGGEGGGREAGRGGGGEGGGGEAGSGGCGEGGG